MGDFLQRALRRLIGDVGMTVLLEKLGMVDAERFISLIIREPFDYTKWRTSLFSEMPWISLPPKRIRILPN